MVIRNTACRTDAVDVCLQSRERIGSSLRQHDPAESETVYVIGLFVYTIGDLLTLNNEKLSAVTKLLVQLCDRRYVFMIGDDKEVIAILFVPSDDIGRRRIAIAVRGMGMRVALEPTGLLLSRSPRY